MTAGQRAALARLKLETRGFFHVHELAGPSKAGTRAELATLLFGVKTPQARAGVTALEAAFYALAGGALIGATCGADRQSRFIAWATAQA